MSEKTAQKYEKLAKRYRKQGQDSLADAFERQAKRERERDAEDINDIDSEQIASDGYGYAPMATPPVMPPVQQPTMAENNAPMMEPPQIPQETPYLSGGQLGGLVKSYYKGGLDKKMPFDQALSARQKGIM